MFRHLWASLAVMLALFPVAAADHDEFDLTVQPWAIDLLTATDVGYGMITISNGNEETLTLELSLSWVPQGWTASLNATYIVVAPGTVVSTGFVIAPEGLAEPGSVHTILVVANGGNTGATTDVDVRIGIPQAPIRQEFEIVGAIGVWDFASVDNCVQRETEGLLPSVNAGCAVVPVRGQSVPFTCSIDDAVGLVETLAITFTSSDRLQSLTHAGRDGTVGGDTPPWAFGIRAQVTGLVASTSVACIYSPPPIFTQL